MGFGRKEEDSARSEDEVEPEKVKLNPDPEQGMEMKKIPLKTTDGRTYPIVIQGQSDPLLKSHHLKYMLIGFNGFITMLGLVLLSLTIWVRVDPEFWEYETTLRVDNLHTVCTMLIVASLVVVIVGFVGCLGAASERRWLILLYMGIFALIFLLELAAVVLMWSAPYSKTINKELEKQIQKQIEESGEDDSARYFIDYIQQHLHCCGAIDAKDYKGKMTPNSCVSQTTGVVYEYGCATRMLSYLRGKAGIIGGIALPILLLQLLALLSAGCLIKSLDVESRYFM